MRIFLLISFTGSRDLELEEIQNLLGKSDDQHYSEFLTLSTLLILVLALFPICLTRFLSGGEPLFPPA